MLTGKKEKNPRKRFDPHPKETKFNEEGLPPKIAVHVAPHITAEEKTEHQDN